MLESVLEDLMWHPEARGIFYIRCFLSNSIRNPALTEMRTDLIHVEPRFARHVRLAVRALKELRDA